MNPTDIAPVVSEALTAFGVPASPLMVHVLALVSLLALAFGTAGLKKWAASNAKVGVLMKALSAVAYGVEKTTPSKGTTRGAILDEATKHGEGVMGVLDEIVQSQAERVAQEKQQGQQGQQGQGGSK